MRPALSEVFLDSRGDNAHHVVEAMLSEADTCRKFITPKRQEAGWDMESHSLAEQRAIKDGRVILVGDKAQRRQPKRPDYLLRYTADFTIAVVEAKPVDRQPTEGLQQAKE